jgi:hypothetical protein
MIEKLSGYLIVFDKTKPPSIAIWSKEYDMEKNIENIIIRK